MSTTKRQREPLISWEALRSTLMVNGIKSHQATTSTLVVADKTRMETTRMTHDDYSKLAEEQSATLQATARMLHIRNKGDDRYLASQLEQAADTLSSLAAQAQEWKKDAERYWWLYNGDVDGLIIMRGTVEHSEDIAALVDGEELDTIIDERIAIATALAAEEKKTCQDKQ